MWGWPGVQHFGPFYHLGLVIPIALFTGLGVVELFNRQRALGCAALVMLVVATGVGLEPKVRPNRAITDAYESRAADLDALQVEKGVVFLEARIAFGWNGIAPFLQNTPDLDGRYVMAQDNRTGNFDVLDRFPDRTPIIFLTVSDPGEASGVRYVPQRMTVDQGPDATATVEITDHEGGHRLVAYARLDDGRIYEQLLDESSAPGFKRTVAWRLTRGEEGGPSVVPLNADGSVELGVRFDTEGLLPDAEHELVFAYRVRDERVQLLRPATAWHRPAEQDGWFHDVSGVVVDRTTGNGR